MKYYFITWWTFFFECWCNGLLNCVPFTYQKIFLGYRYTLRCQKFYLAQQFRHVTRYTQKTKLLHSLLMLSISHKVYVLLTNKGPSFGENCLQIDKRHTTLGPLSKSFLVRENCCECGGGYIAPMGAGFWGLSGGGCSPGLRATGRTISLGIIKVEVGGESLRTR